MNQWLRHTFAALGDRHFRFLAIGTFLSFLAFFMSTIVQSVVAFELTGSNGAVGFVIFAQGVAMLVLGPIGGAFADRWPKRRVIAVGQSVTGIVFAVVALLMAADLIHVLWLAGGSFIMGICFAFLGPARLAFAIQLVPGEQRGNAMAVNQIANNASRVLGPAVAGLLLAWSVSGAAGAYASMAGLYLISVVMLAWLPHSPGRSEIDTHVLSDVADGLRYVRDHRRLRVLVVLFVTVTMTCFPYVTVLPGLVEHEFGLAAEAISLMAGVSAAGGLAASLAVARYADSQRAGAVFVGMGMASGLLLFVVAIAPDFATATAAMFALGAATGGFQTLSAAVIVRETEGPYVGRVMSLSMLAFAGFGLMGLPIGLFADAVGERGALVAMGITVCAIVLASRVALARSPGPAPAAKR